MQVKKPNSRFSQIIFFLIFLFTLYLSYLGHAKNFDRVVIRSDGTGYYEYLPAFINYGDPWLEKIRERRKHEIAPTIRYNLVEFTQGHYVIKYPMGTAVLQAPFYLAAHIFCLIHPEYQANSYTSPYHAAVSVAATTYLLLGCLLLFIVLREKYSDNLLIFTFLITIFGTNLFHYSTFDASFSHVYSFFAVSLWFFSLTRYFKLYSYTSALLAGVSLGIVFLVRNTDIIYALLFIPFFIKSCGNGQIRFGQLVLIFFGVLLTVAPQFIYYFAAYNKFVLSSYGLRGEGFTNLRSPQLGTVLFSVKSGLFFWSPVVLISLISFLYGCVRGSERLFSAYVLLLFSIQSYIIASWWKPDFSGGFGHRGFVEFLPLTCIGILSALSILKKKALSFYILAVILIIMTTYSSTVMLGYWNGIIPYANAEFSHIKNTFVHFFPF